MIKEQARGLLHLWKFTKGNRVALVGAGLIAIVSSAVSLVQPQIANRVISEVQGGNHLDIRLIAALVAAVVLVGLLAGVRGYLTDSTAEGVVFRVRRSACDSVVSAPLNISGHWEPGDITSRVTTDAEAIKDGISTGIVDVCAAVLLCFGATFALITIDLPSFCIVFGAVVLVAIGSAIGAPIMKRATESRHTALGELSSVIERFFNGILLVKTYGLENDVKRASESAAQTVKGYGLYLAKIRALLLPISNLSIEIAFIVVLLFGAFRVASGDLSIGELTAFVMYISLLVMPVGTLLNAVTALSAALGAQQRLFDLERERTNIPTPGRSLTGQRDRSGHLDLNLPPTLESLVEFRDVSFAYPGTDQLAADCVSFRVPKNSVTAIVGPSGAGKSTLISLLARLYTPTQGTILYRGKPIDSVCSTDYRDSVSVSLQGGIHWGRTLWDSVTLGSEIDEGEVLELFDRLGLDEFLQNLPNGFRSPNGTVMASASAGELQRISLARALLRKPALLILDEPTSNLDGRNEELVTELIAEIKGSCTVLLVAHRSRSVDAADFIIELRAGRVANSYDNTRTLNRDEAIHLEEILSH